MKYLLSFFIALIFAFSAFGQASGANQNQQIAPSFKVVSIDGKVFNSPDLRGKVIVLNLWFVNCPHCIEEINLLNKIVDEYRGNSDVVFIGLAINNKTKLESFLKKIPFKYNIVPDAGDFMLLGFGDKQKDGSYYLPFPTHVVIDKEGKITVKTSGAKGVTAVRDELARQFGSSSKTTK